jgi:hypothetical protein
MGRLFLGSSDRGRSIIRVNFHAEKKILVSIMQGSHYFEIRGRSDFSFRCGQKRSILFFSQSECKLVHKAQKFHFCHNLEFRRDFFLIVDLRVLKLISSRLSFLLFYCFVSSISWKLVKEAKQNNMRAMRAKSQ